MEKVLLISYDWSLRQLYHELLLSKDIEVTPIDNIEDAIMLLTIGEFAGVAIYIDKESHNQVLTLLQLRKKHTRWGHLQFFILSAEGESFKRWLLPCDLILNPLLDSPMEITQKIKQQFKESQLEIERDY